MRTCKLTHVKSYSKNKYNKSLLKVGCKSFTLNLNI